MNGERLSDNNEIALLEKALRETKSVERSAVSARRLLEMVPGLKAAFGHVEDFLHSEREVRIALVTFVCLGGNATSEQIDKFAKDLQDEATASAVFRKAIDDDEREKTWVYGIALRSFLRNEIPADQRVAALRFFQDLMVRDLRALVELQATKFGARIRAVAAGGKLEKEEQEEFSKDLFSLERDQRTLVQALMRWGFFRDRRGPLPPWPIGQGLPAVLDILDVALRNA